MLILVLLLMKQLSHQLERPSVLDRLLEEDEDKEDSETFSTLEETKCIFRTFHQEKEDPLCWWRGVLVVFHWLFWHKVLGIPATLHSRDDQCFGVLT